MIIPVAIQRELLLPLAEGVHESPPWGEFLRNLVARSGARRALLIITLAESDAWKQPTVVQVSAPRAKDDIPLDFRQISSLGLHPYGSLRPGRVYALEEMFDYADPARVAGQRAALEELGIRYGRWLRVSVPGMADAWFLLVREREDFAASAGAMLSAIAPHFVAVLRTLTILMQQRLRIAMAENTLARLGIGQLAFDAGGRVLAVDPTAEAMLSFAPEAGLRASRLNLHADASRALDQGCATLAASAQSSKVIALNERVALNMILRKSDLDLPEPGSSPAAIGLVRARQHDQSRDKIEALASIHGLSHREAALAYALSCGESLINAGRTLQLTDETTRNYSKRIYAKTRTSGQADLVRLILTGLAPLA